MCIHLFMLISGKSSYFFVLCHQHQDGDDIEATKLQQDCLASVAKNICLICKGEGQLL